MTSVIQDSCGYGGHRRRTSQVMEVGIRLWSKKKAYKTPMYEVIAALVVTGVLDAHEK